MTDTSTAIKTLASSFRSKQKVDVSSDKYLDYAHDLTHRECHIENLSSLTSKYGTILLRQQVYARSKSVVVNACDYLNLFKDQHVTDCKAKINTLTSLPQQATVVTIAFIRAGDHNVTNFTEHLKVYFDTPRILHPGHVFCLKIPEVIPTNVPLKTWVKHAAGRQNFCQASYLAHFKVISAFVGEDEIASFFYISSENSTLYESPNIHEKIPLYLPDKKVDVFYSVELQHLESQLRRDVFTPLILIAEKGNFKLAHYY